MRALTLALSLPLCLALLACPPPAPSFRYYVDADTGVDANAGTEKSPFQTITKALSVAVAGEWISVAPGSYDGTNGEAFPLMVPAGVGLVGDEATKGFGGIQATAIIGTGGVVLAPGDDSTIAGFLIRTSAAAGPATGVDIAASRVTLRNNTIVTNDTYGVHVRAASAGHAITGNDITDNGPAAGTTGAGLAFKGGGAGSLVAGNTIRDNGIGVEIDMADVDLGGGASGSAGGNELSCNRGNDLVTGSTLVSARSNRWDDVPPSEAGVASDGGDLLAADPFDVDVTGSSLAAVPCPFYDYYVDANAGSDANAGTQAAPFGSIDHALGVASSGETVKAAPGAYDLPNGEAFPLFVPAGVTLLGDPRSRGQGPPATRIFGGGSVTAQGQSISAAVQMGNGATLRGFEVTNPMNLATDDVGVSLGFPAISGTMANVLDNALVDNGRNGLDARNVDDLVVSGNLATRNENGMNFRDGGADSTISDNEVVANTGSGIIFQGSLNAMSTDVSPGNILSCNLQRDLSIGAAAGFDVDATSNRWDHAPPTESVGLVGVDIAFGSATFSALGASLAPAFCP